MGSCWTPRAVIIDHYDTLGIDSGADAETVRQAYRGQAQRHHPDKGGDADTFHAVQRAYDVLSNPEARAHYDATGDDAPPDHEQIAQARLMALLDRMIESPPNDLIGAATQAVRDSTSEFRQRQQQAERRRERLLDLRGRVERTDEGVNLYQHLIDQKLHQIEAETHNLDTEIEINDRVLALLACYRDTGGTATEALFGHAHFDVRV